MVKAAADLQLQLKKRSGFGRCFPNVGYQKNGPSRLVIRGPPGWEGKRCVGLQDLLSMRATLVQAVSCLEEGHRYFSVFEVRHSHWGVWRF